MANDGDCLSKCVTGLNWPVVWPVGKAGGRCLLGQWGNMTPTKKPDAEKRNAEREAALTFVRWPRKRTGPDRARRTAQTVHQKRAGDGPGRGDDRAPGPRQAQEIQGRQGREHAQRHHRQDRGHRFGRPGQDRGAARPRWRTVFVSPTLLMLPGVIVMMALPARVRANPTSGTRPSSAGSSWSHTCTSNARTMRSPPCRSSCSPPRRRGASADSSRADASTRPEMDQNPE